MRNAKTYMAQVYKILTRATTETRFNSEWMDKMKGEDWVRLAARFTVSQMLEREEFHKRFQEEKPIAMHELLYPLVQGYDSVALKADVELGGTDQKFNLQVGRELQRSFGQESQVVLTMPILEGLDGVQKMSKSFGNAIGIQEPALEMYGKIMSISDEMMWRYFELVTDVQLPEIEKMKREAHPMEAKKDLARRIVTDFHSAEAALKAAEDWTKQFQKDEVPEGLESIEVKIETVSTGDVMPDHLVPGARGTARVIGDSHDHKNCIAIRVDKLIRQAGLASSNTEAAAKIKGKAVSINGTNLDESDLVIICSLREMTLRVGRRMKSVRLVGLAKAILALTQMFTKILIANRGEIAVRVIRACREMGIAPVAVYSDADRASLHVRMAAEAYHIGASPTLESYLDIEKIVSVAKRCGAEALHPGYGFLSENANFAEACGNAGIKFIGPSPESMRVMGSKTRARQQMEKNGVPCVPGNSRVLESLEEAARIADEIGYPVMLKAAAGGGGKGMRLVREPGELRPALEAAQSEAQRAFGDGGVYIEKAIVNPRHVEIQILADEHGNTIHLGERECSIQRRHQKVIEESPSPAVDVDLRKQMGDVAVQAASAWHTRTRELSSSCLIKTRSFIFLR